MSYDPIVQGAHRGRRPRGRTILIRCHTGPCSTHDQLYRVSVRALKQYYGRFRIRLNPSRLSLWPRTRAGWLCLHRWVCEPSKDRNGRYLLVPLDAGGRVGIPPMCARTNVWPGYFGRKLEPLVTQEFRSNARRRTRRPASSVRRVAHLASRTPRRRLPGCDQRCAQHGERCR